MNVNAHGLTLEAHSAAGDAAIVRDADGQLWLIVGSRMRRVEGDALDRAVALHDYVRSGRQFATMAYVEVALEELAAEWRDGRGSIDDQLSAYSVIDIDELLEDADKVSDPQAFTRLLTRLLNECPAARDERVFRRLAALVASQGTTPTERPTRAS